MHTGSAENVQAPAQPLLQKAIPFVLSVTAGTVTFAVLTVSYMDKFSYLSDGAKTSTPTWNTAALIFSALAAYGVARFVIFKPSRMFVNHACRVYRESRGQCSP